MSLVIAGMVGWSRVSPRANSAWKASTPDRGRDACRGANPVSPRTTHATGPQRGHDDAAPGCVGGR